MCRSEAARLMADKPPMKIRPANDDSKARVSIEGKSFAEARKQDELYSRHELKADFREDQHEDKIQRAKEAFDEAVKILQKAKKTTQKN